MFNTTFVKLLRKKQSSRYLFILVILFSLLVMANENAMAGSATLTWIAPTTNNDGTPFTPAGYKVYAGTASGVYGAPTDIGFIASSTPSYTVNNLGTATYYFAVSAYNSTGVESGLSNEQSKTFTASGGSAPPPTTNNLTSQQNMATGGCGMISPKDNKPSNPEEAADMLAIIILLLVMLARKLFRKSGITNGFLSKLKEKVMLVKKLGYLYLLIGCILGFIGQSFAATSSSITITGISGILTSGSTLTISGSGFGTKNPAKPLVWADFEAGNMNPSPLGQLSTWYDSQNMGYTTSGCDNGSGCVTATGSCGACTIGVFYNSFSSPGQKSYVYKKFKMDFAITDTSQNWKQMRLWPTTGLGYTPDLHFSPGDGTLLVEGLPVPGGGYYISPLSAVRFPANTWLSEEFLLKGSTQGNTDGLFEILHNNSLANPPQSYADNFMTSNASYPAYMAYWYVVHGVSANSSTWSPAYPAGGIHIWADDIYVDTTWSRVMVCNASTYSACTNLTPQIPSAWSDTSITVTLHQGQLPNLNKMYLYVFDSNGNVNTNGFPLCATCPGPPLSLNVQ